MPDQKIVEYIKSQLSAGFDRNKIRNELLMNGSLPSEIDLAFNSLNNNMQNSNTPVQNIPNSAPAYNPPPAYSPINSAPVFTEQPARGSIFKKILVTVVVLVLLGGISAGAYFGYNYYKDSQMTLGGAIIKTGDALASGQITSGELSFVAEVTAKNVGQNYSNLMTDAASKQITGQLQDVAVKLAYSGIVNKTSDGKFETSGDLSASVKNPNGGSLGMFGSQELGLKYKTFSDNIFVNIQSLPAITAMMIPPTIDTSKYLNQWFSIPTAMTDQYSKTYTGNISTTTILSDDSRKQMISLFDESGAFTVVDKKSEKTDKGTAVTALYIKIDWDKFGDEVIKISKANGEKDGGTPFTKSKELELRTNLEKIKELPVSNSLVKILIGNDGYIHGFVSSGDLMDKSNNQIGSFKISFSVDSFNQSFTIDRPMDARSFTEVMAEIGNLMNTSGGKTTSSNSSKTITPIKTGSTGSASYGPVLKSGILSVQKTANMTIDKGSVTVDGKLQSSTTFEAGKAYTIYLSGVKGFTEFTQYGAPAKFVDFTGKFTVYDENNKIVKNVDNIFSSYIGGIPAVDAQYLQTKLTLPADFSAGSYRWEFIVTDKKNSSNSIKAVVNFKI